MPTTTNYGWTTPADTDLVKDGAAAIRTLGSSIDTTVFNNASAGIPKTIVDAKGDLIAGTASDTVSRLAVGTNGQALIADSTAATGMKWDTPAAGGMTLISTTTLTGASVTLSSIPSTYVNLQLIITNFRPTNDTESIVLRFNGDSATRYKTNFDASGNGTYDSTYVELNGRQDGTVAQGLTNLDIPYYANTTTWKMFRGLSVGNDTTTTTSFRSQNFQGLYNQLSAISSIVLLTTSGNFTSGTALLYGVK
jgi:hypothetical protein